jgi:collagen type I/II/III/V/XI/XXIV/XXVII alpha
LGQA